MAEAVFWKPVFRLRQIAEQKEFRQAAEADGSRLRTAERQTLVREREGFVEYSGPIPRVMSTRKPALSMVGARMGYSADVTGDFIVGRAPNRGFVDRKLRKTILISTRSGAGGEAFYLRAPDSLQAQERTASRNSSSMNTRQDRSTAALEHPGPAISGRAGHHRLGAGPRAALITSRRSIWADGE